MFGKRFSWFAVALLVILSMVLTACGGAAPTAAPETPAEQPGEEMPAEKQQVEVFSWWTGGGEAAGLEAMIKVFNEKYPDIEFINAAVAGGAGTNARAVLATRLQAGDAPDSWQG
ncbi:MAG: ABC transporter substrate-binding protein, partial [Anaerolineaceae bacterium]|nr:ABC transporter substrate-binding protein [Anaerolineaceae bacterium]